MKDTTTVINWIVQSGLLIWLFYFALGIAEPWVTSHIKHAKTAQQREAWELLEQVAMTTVNSLVNANLKGNQKFDEATNQTLAFLDNHGIHVDKRTVQSAIQAAYEKSPLTGSSISKVVADANGITTTISKVNASEITSGSIDPKAKADPVLKAIETAPNRANDLSKEGDK